MPKSPVKFDRPAIQRYLSNIRDTLDEKHAREVQAIGSRIPIGGDHMDGFFRSEGLRGLLESLRKGKTLEYAVAQGKSESRNAVRIWNSRREYQVHRWEETAFDFIDTTVRNALQYA